MPSHKGQCLGSNRAGGKTVRRVTFGAAMVAGIVTVRGAEAQIPRRTPMLNCVQIHGSE